MSKKDNKRFKDSSRTTAPKRGGKNRRDYGENYTYEPKRGSGRSASAAGRDAGRSASAAGRDAGRSVSAAGRDAGRSVSAAGRNAGRSASAAGRNAGRSASAAGRNAGRSASAAGRNGGRSASAAGHGADRRKVLGFGMEERYEAMPVVGADGLEIIAGRNPVTEALEGSREVERIFIADGAEGSVSKIVAIAREQGVIVDFVPKERIDAMAPGAKHQGVVAKVSEYRYAGISEVFERAEKAGEDPFIIILDEISDPHNLGAIIRTAECVGAHGIIIPKRRAASLTQTVALSAAGAIENMPVVQVTNIARTIEELQNQGVWVGAADMDGETYYDASLTGSIAIVIGNEGKGVGRLVKEKCDFVLSIPMYGKINSLNASNAAAVLMYGIRRARNSSTPQL